MTKAEFSDIAKKLKVAFRRDNFLSDNDMMELWYERLGQFDKSLLMTAANNYIDANTFQPTIADIRTEYQKLLEERNEINQQLREIYSMTRGIYPDAHLNDDDETREAAKKDAQSAWWDLIKGYPLEERIDRARHIEDITNQYVRKVELDPKRMNKIPPLEDFFRGAR